MPDPATEPVSKSATALRLLHTADWHLGKMLGDLDRSDEHRRFLQWLLVTLVREQVDVLLISGDIFDTANPPQSAERMYFEFLAEVYRKTQCTVVVTGGNHDSPAHLEAPRQVLHTLNVHITGSLPSNIEDVLVPLPTAEAPQVVVAAVPFLRDRDLRTGSFGQTAEEIRDELRRGIESVYRSAAEACVSCRQNGAALLAMGHLTVAGARVSESERVVHVGGLGKVDHKTFPEEFAYVALGHLHRPQAMGSENIRYSGSPIPLSFSECEDVKEVRLLDIADGEVIANFGLPIPFTRRLAQLKTSRLDLESALEQLAPARGALPSWVEVTVETTDSSENLFELVRKLTERRRDDFDVIRVQARRERTGTAALSNESTVEELRGGDALLDDPLEVFERRLSSALELGPAESDELRVAFRELYQLQLDAEGEGKKVATPSLQSAEDTPIKVETAEELLFNFDEEGAAK